MTNWEAFWLGMLAMIYVDKVDTWLLAKCPAWRGKTWQAWPRRKP
jgi:hypothetical protein